MTTKKECARVGCTNEAKWTPSISLWAPGYYGKPAHVIMPIFACDAHRLTDPNEWITDAGWETICKGFDEANFARPDRSRVKITFESIDDPRVVSNLQRLHESKN
jgi:hypothetical protein